MKARSKGIFVKLQRSSYQYHHKRQEAWTVVSGIATITIDGETNHYQPGETVLIPLKYRMANEEPVDMVLIEVQTGTYFGEDDIVRIEDDYDRENKMKKQ